MRKLMLFCVLTAVVCLGMVGCAKMPTRADYVYEQPSQAIMADAEAGLIYFLRESRFTGGGISYFIFEDDKKIGVLKSGTYFAYKSIPGKHSYWAETEAKDTITIDIQPGEIYYIEGGVDMGLWAGRPKLTEVTRPVAEKFLPDLQYIRLSTEATREKERPAL